MFDLLMYRDASVKKKKEKSGEKKFHEQDVFLLPGERSEDPIEIHETNATTARGLWPVQLEVQTHLLP